MPPLPTIILLVSAQGGPGGMCGYASQQYIVPDPHLTMLSAGAPRTPRARTSRDVPTSLRTPERTPRWR